MKFSGDRVDVQVGVTRHGNQALVSVRDRGPGLPPDEAKRIFKRFYRVPGALTQRVKGTGLGPLHRAERGEAPRRPRLRRERRVRHRGNVLPRTAGRAAGGHRLTVMASLLLVEDEPHIASGLRFNLEAEDHSVDIAETGELALERLAVDPHATTASCSTSCCRAWTDSPSRAPPGRGAGSRRSSCSRPAGALRMS